MADKELQERFPSGKFKTIRRGLFCVRPYGSYEVFDYSRDTIAPETTTDLFEELRPYLLKIYNRRFYIGSTVKQDEIKKGEREGEKYDYLPVYTSLRFGSLCSGRLIREKENPNFWIGTIYGNTIRLDLSKTHDYVKKDDSVLTYYVAEITRY